MFPEETAILKEGALLPLTDEGNPQSNKASPFQLSNFLEVHSLQKVGFGVIFFFSLLYCVFYVTFKVGKINLKNVMKALDFYFLRNL